MLDVDVDIQPWLMYLEDGQQRQIPFAMKTAINTTLVAVQDAERAHMRNIFEERRPSWLDQSVKITHFATKQEMYGVVGIHPPGGDARADIITKFEDQTTKTPAGKTIAIPIEARRNKSDIVLNNHRPKALMGNDKVFVIRKPNGVGLILQRVTRGAAKGTNKLLYLLIPKAKITPDLAFEETAVKTIDAKWETAFDFAWAQAVGTAK